MGRYWHPHTKKDLIVWILKYYPDWNSLKHRTIKELYAIHYAILNRKRPKHEYSSSVS
jgi:hypothetical protein